MAALTLKGKPAPITAGGKGSRFIGALNAVVTLNSSPLSEALLSIEKMTNIKKASKGISKITFTAGIVEGEAISRITSTVKRATRDALKEVLIKNILPVTPASPEYHIDWTGQIPAARSNKKTYGQYEGFIKLFREQYIKQGMGPAEAQIQARYDATYLLFPEFVDKSIFKELSGGLSDNYETARGKERAAKLKTNRIPLKGLDGFPLGPGVAGFHTNEAGQAFTGNNYNAYIYFARDQHTARYASMANKENANFFGVSFARSSSMLKNQIVKALKSTRDYTRAEKVVSGIEPATRFRRI